MGTGWELQSFAILRRRDSLVFLLTHNHLTEIISGEIHEKTETKNVLCAPLRDCSLKTHMSMVHIYVPPKKMKILGNPKRKGTERGGKGEKNSKQTCPQTDTIFFFADSLAHLTFSGLVISVCVLFTLSRSFYRSTSSTSHTSCLCCVVV